MRDERRGEVTTEISRFRRWFRSMWLSMKVKQTTARRIRLVFEECLARGHVIIIKKSPGSLPTQALAESDHRKQPLT